MKNFFLLLPLLTFGCASLSHFDKSVAGHQLPGHWVQNHCLEYARALNLALSQQGTNSIHLSYEWRKTFGTTEGRHSFVVFEDRAGQLWGMDNGMKQPKRLRGHTELELARSFDPEAYRMIDVDDWSFRLYARTNQELGFGNN